VSISRWQAHLTNYWLDSQGGRRAGKYNDDTNLTTSQLLISIVLRPGMVFRATFYELAGVDLGLISTVGLLLWFSSCSTTFYTSRFCTPRDTTYTQYIILHFQS
jgi:hypothetical protein